VKAKSGIVAVLLCGTLFVACLDQKPVKRLEELEALNGKSAGEVLSILGSPKIVDSTSSSTEQIWGYYQVMVRSEVDAKPRQRTVLLVLTKKDTALVVEKVRIP
jgi:hypothetical protein